MKRNFSTYCCIRLPLNIYEPETSLFFRLGFSLRESVSAYIVLLHLTIYTLLFLSSFPRLPKAKGSVNFFFPILVTVIYISSPFHCFSPWICQACSNLRFTLKVTESPLTWQRLCMSRTAVLGGDPLAWAGAFNLGDASRLGGISLLLQSLYSFRSSWIYLWQVNLPVQCSRWFPMGMKSQTQQGVISLSIQHPGG